MNNCDCPDEGHYRSCNQLGSKGFGKTDFDSKVWYICAMCSFETTDEAQAYAHDCMGPS